MERFITGCSLDAKAYNARVIVAWLACLQIAVGEEPAQPGRLCGLWTENGRDWPQHDLLLPSVAMNLRLV